MSADRRENDMSRMPSSGAAGAPRAGEIGWPPGRTSGGPAPEIDRPPW